MRCAGDDNSEVFCFDRGESCRPRGLFVFLDSRQGVFPGFSIVIGILDFKIADRIEHAGTVVSAGNHPGCTEVYLLVPSVFDDMGHRPLPYPTGTVVFDFSVAIVEQDRAIDTVGFLRTVRAQLGGAREVFPDTFEPLRLGKADLAHAFAVFALV